MAAIRLRECTPVMMCSLRPARPAGNVSPHTSHRVRRRARAAVSAAAASASAAVAASAAAAARASALGTAPAAGFRVLLSATRASLFPTVTPTAAAWTDPIFILIFVFNCFASMSFETTPRTGVGVGSGIGLVRAAVSYPDTRLAVFPGPGRSGIPAAASAAGPSVTEGTQGT